MWNDKALDIIFMQYNVMYKFETIQRFRMFYLMTMHIYPECLRKTLLHQGRIVLHACSVTVRLGNTRWWDILHTISISIDSQLINCITNFVCGNLCHAHLLLWDRGMQGNEIYYMQSVLIYWFRLSASGLYLV